MNTRFLKTTLLALSVGAIPAAIALMPPGGSNPVCYVETWFDTYQLQTGNCATYQDCPRKVLCAIGVVDKNFSTITTGPFPCNDFTGGTMTGGVCGGGTPVIPSTVSVIIVKQSCSGGC